MNEDTYQTSPACATVVDQAADITDDEIFHFIADMGHAMRLVYDDAFDGYAWPGPLAAQRAVVGVKWVGLRGFLDVLEVMTGVTRPPVPPASRVAKLVGSLARKTARKTGNYWDASYIRDPFATAQRLLRDRDALFMAGWTGQALSPELMQLAEATAGLDFGTPDRIRHVTEHLPRSPLPLESISLVEPLEQHPPVLVELFLTLQKSGVRLECVAPPLPTRSSTDLEKMVRKTGLPTGDGSLLLLRPHGPAAAAQDLASWLATHFDTSQIVIVGGDEILQHALKRYGLPAPGCAALASSVLAVLPLVLEMAQDPIDPADAHEFLSLPATPVPKRLARRLIGALQQQPSTCSDAWNEALAQFSHDVGDSPLEIFRPSIPRAVGQYPLSTLRTRVALVKTWASSSRQSSHNLPFEDLTDCCDNLLEVADAVGWELIPVSTLRKWLRSVMPRRSRTRVAAEVGISHVDGPEAVWGPAKTVIWWNFSANSVFPPARIRLSRASLEGLRQAGIMLPTPQEQALQQARRWRRPLDFAIDRLILVCPQTDSHAKRNHPHPLWDDLTCSVPQTQRLSALKCVQTRTPPIDAVHYTTPKKRELPVARTYWTCEPIVLREQESPSSLEKLARCSFQYALTYRGGIAPGASTSPRGVDALTQGSFAHELLRALARGLPKDPALAGSRAELLFDELVGRHVAVLNLPIYHDRRASLKRQLVRAAAALAHVLNDLGATVLATEEAREGVVCGVKVGGRLDLILSNNTVIDYKWGSRDKYRKALENGTALQLALYAALLHDNPDEVAVGYFIVSSSDILLLGKTAASAVAVVGARPATILQSVQR